MVGGIPGTKPVNARRQRTFTRILVYLVSVCILKRTLEADSRDGFGGNSFSIDVSIVLFVSPD